MLLRLATLASSLRELSSRSHWPARSKGQRSGLVWSDGRRLHIAAVSECSTRIWEVANGAGHIHEIEAVGQSEPFGPLHINMLAMHKMCARAGYDTVSIKPLPEQRGLLLTFTSTGVVAPKKGRKPKKQRAPQETKLLADDLREWMSGDDLPPLVQAHLLDGAASSTIDLARWVPALGSVLPCVSDDPRRPLIHRVQLRGLWMLASDGHRIAAARVGRHALGECDIPLTLARALADLDPQGTLELRHASGTYALTSTSDGLTRTTIIRTKMDDHAPELLRLTAKYVDQARNGCMFQLARNDLQAALLQAKCVVGERSDFIQPVKLRGDSDGLVVAADSPSTHAFFSTRLDARARGNLAAAECWVSFKLRYMLDAVAQVDTEQVVLGISHAIGEPVVLRGAGRIVVILPIRMDANERAPDYDAWRVHADAEEAHERQRKEAEARHAARVAAGRAGPQP